MEFRPVAVESVALVPVKMHPQGQVHPHTVPFAAGHAQEHLDHGAEKKPVAHIGLPGAGFLHPVRQGFFVLIGEESPQLARSAQDGVAEKGRVHDGLLAGGEVHLVPGAGRDGKMDGPARHFAVFRPEGVLFRGQGAFGFEPGRDAGQDAAEGLQVGILHTVLRRKLAPDGEFLPEAVPGEGGKHGTGDGVHDADPERTC